MPSALRWPLATAIAGRNVSFAANNGSQSDSPKSALSANSRHRRARGRCSPLPLQARFRDKTSYERPHCVSCDCVTGRIGMSVAHYNVGGTISLNDR
jgi:hypothetical protein